MAFSDFYIMPSGSDVNAGSTSGLPTYSSTSGGWNGSSVFTPTDGSTPSNAVSAGMWASIYPNGSTKTPYIAQVTSVGSGTNGTITFSTTNYFGTAPSSSTSSANCVVGGAWADFGIIASGAALASGTVTQSTRVNVQAATYANSTSSLTFALAGTAATPLWWRGYQNTPGDQDSNPLATAGTSIPAITFTTGQMLVTGSNQVFSSLDVSGAYLAAGTNAQLNVSAGVCTFYRFRIQNTASNANGVALKFGSGVVSATLVSCYIKATTAAAEVVNCAAGTHRFTGCYISGGAKGVAYAATSAMFFGCVFDSCGGDAINTNTTTTLSNCSFYAPTGNGINITAVPTAGVSVSNCYFDTVNQPGKYAINNSSGTNTDLISAIANAYYNCTGTVNGLGDFPLIFDNGILAASAFANPSTQNFVLNSNGYGLGFPGGLEKLASSVGYLDIGALQHQAGGMGQIMRVVGQHFPVW